MLSILLVAVKNNTKVLSSRLDENNNFTQCQINECEINLNKVIKIQWHVAWVLIVCELYTSYALLVINF